MNRSLGTLGILGGLAYLACGFMSNWRSDTFIALFWILFGLFVLGVTAGGIKYRKPAMLIVAAALGFPCLAFGCLVAIYEWLHLDV